MEKIKKTDTDWVTGTAFWSSTELSNFAAYAWVINLHYGNSTHTFKTSSSSLAVRCVLRD